MKSRGPLLFALGLFAVCLPIRVAAGARRAQIVIVMVWDGLRPDLVTARDTPSLYAMARAGVRFDNHHSVYPTVTMANAAALATGAEPGATGILGDRMYLLPALSQKGAALINYSSAPWTAEPIGLEDSSRLSTLNGLGGFAGRLLGLDTVAQELEREGGYLAVVGKDGPAFLWDNRVTSVINGRDSLFEAHKDYLFVTDRTAGPKELAQELLGALPRLSLEGVVDSTRDEYFTRLIVERALPAARDAARAGRQTLIVLWLHNPDATQHFAGLGTQPAFEALAAADTNLAKVRAAIAAAGVADNTDLIVVSDHGFATIRLTVDLNALLAAAGLKQSLTSTDVVIARNGGTDFVYLSREAFPTAETGRAELQKIVDFAEAQEWCGPIFSRHAAISNPNAPLRKPYLGWIDGTFAQTAVGIFDPARSPDLAISFRELPNQYNQGVTGPGNPAFALGRGGQLQVPNRSKPLVRAIPGLGYMDSAGIYTTGMGTHGAAGARELHNFCAAVGPDFRRGFVDRTPTGNADVAPTIAHILGLQPNIGPAGVHPSGRVLTEALTGGRPPAGRGRAITMTARRALRDVETVTTLRFTRLADHDYLDGSSVERDPLGTSP